MTQRHDKRRGAGMGSPINQQDTSYTLQRWDADSTIYKSSGGAGETITIPANSAVPFPVGTLIGIKNDGGGDLTVAITSDTLEGTDGATGSRTLANNNTALIHKVSPTKWSYSSTETAAAGAAPEYADFYLVGAGFTGLGAGPVDAQIDTTRINSDTGIFTLASNEVTVNKTAVFKFTMEVAIHQATGGTGSSSSYAGYLTTDTGAGHAEVPGTRSEDYVPNNQGGTLTAIAIISVTSGDKFKMAVVRTVGTASTVIQLSAGTRLTIEEMA
jgi:hypothetical protein